MKNRGRILIALFSALVLLMAVTLTGCFGDDEERRMGSGGGGQPFHPGHCDLPA